MSVEGFLVICWFIMSAGQLGLVRAASFTSMWLSSASLVRVSGGQLGLLAAYRRRLVSGWFAQCCRRFCSCCCFVFFGFT